MEHKPLVTSSALPKELKNCKQKQEDIIETPMRIEARFGVNVKLLRRKRCITQVELAKRCGLHQNYISEIEHGKRNVTLRVIETIAKALEGHEKEFFNWRE